MEDKMRIKWYLGITARNEVPGTKTFKKANGFLYISQHTIFLPQNYKTSRVTKALMMKTAIKIDQVHSSCSAEMSRNFIA